ncbi:MAG: TetR/AcrR family transcriptional regulator [Phenylobacterium sp.]|nr:TetR/AcrR family transcriptional regulator [Phenylobacterium sp.]
MESTTETPERRGRGRPRDTRLQEKIETAALTVLARHGFSGLTLERICAESGAPKATFYRRWPTPVACVMDAYGRVWSGAEYKDTGAPQHDLEAFANLLMQLYGHPLLGPCSLAIQSEGRVNPEVDERVRSRALERRARNAAALQAALDRMPRRPALPAPLILNALNGVTRNVQTLRWPVSEDELRLLIQSLLSPPG